LAAMVNIAAPNNMHNDITLQAIIFFIWFVPLLVE
jgi:hypothetical protein